MGAPFLEFSDLVVTIFAPERCEDAFLLCHLADDLGSAHRARWAGKEPTSGALVREIEIGFLEVHVASAVGWNVDTIGASFQPAPDAFER